MKSGFKDKVGSKETKKFKSPWDFTQPAYDQRTSCFVNAGTEYGVGKKTPVGTEGNPKGPHAIPMGRVNTMRVDNMKYDTLESQ